MIFFINIISFLWLIRTIKLVLFWIYLWQLKEYHIGRLIDHFRTKKGRQLIFGTLPIIKIVLLILLSINNYFLYVLLFLYGIESLSFIYGIALKKLKKPVFTAKVALLTIISFLAVGFYLFIIQKSNNLVFLLLIFDILLPLITSLVILFFQPFFVLVRSSILEKARGRIKRFGKNLIVIGITGSYGKTSTKEFLTKILSFKFNVLSTKDNQNSEIGIANCILNNLNKNHQVFIAEMGSYNKGGIKLLCDIIKPKIGIVTGVNEQHLATFGSMENLLSAEGGRELAHSLPKNGLIVVNGDNKYCLDLYKKVNVNRKIYTLKKDKIDSDIWTEELTINKNSLDFVVISKNKEVVHFNVNVLGKQNIQNILGAILVAKELGMGLEEISLASKKIKQEQAGITLKKGIYGIDIVDSSYSSNPDGVLADLDYLNVFPQKKVVIMPCLIELGNKSAEIHEQIGKKIAEVCGMAIIITKDKFKNIKNGAVKNGMPEDKVLFCEKPKEIFNLITTFCKEGDAILLEGRVPNELTKLMTAR